MTREEFQTKLYSKPTARRWPQRHVGSWMWRGAMPVMRDKDGVHREGYNCYYDPRRLPVVVSASNLTDGTQHGPVENSFLTFLRRFLVPAR